MKIHLTTPWLEIIFEPPIVPWFYTLPHPSAVTGMWHFISMSLFSYLYNVLIIEWTWKSYSENRNETCSGFLTSLPHSKKFVLDKLLLTPKTMTRLECNWSHQISIKNGREFRGSIPIPPPSFFFPKTKTWSILSNMRIMMHKFKSVRELDCCWPAT